MNQLSATKGLARAITIVENGDSTSADYRDILSNLVIPDNIPVIGVTGPPGAGKSTLVNELIAALAAKSKRIGVIAVDPTSPFNFGSLLGDRIRMGEHFSNPNIFIRSLATRGSLGGLSAKTIEITDLMKAAGFDYIFIETVGVGQSEVEISGLADTTIVVLVPEGGDEIQAMKSGIMEIADIFVVNKSDRPGANEFISNLHKLIKQKNAHALWKIPVIAAVATEKKGTEEIIEAILKHNATEKPEKKSLLLADKAYHLIQNKRMQDVNKKALAEEIKEQMKKGGFNLYRFVDAFDAK